MTSNLLGNLLAFCRRVEPAVAVVGGVASIIIAYFAFQIDREMRDANVREARTERAHSLATEIAKDGGDLDRMGMLGFEIERRAELLTFAGRRTGETEVRPELYRRALAASAGSFVSPTSIGVTDPMYGDLRSSAILSLIDDIHALLKCADMKLDADEIDRIVDLGWDRERLHVDRPPLKLCNDASASMFLGETLFRTFVHTRPLFFCDEQITRMAPYVQIFLVRHFVPTYAEAGPGLTAQAHAAEPGGDFPYDFLFRFGEDAEEQETLCALYRSAMRKAPDEPVPTLASLAERIGALAN